MKQGGPGSTTSLRAVVEQSADGTHRVTLSGAIDENADLAALFAKLNGDAVVDMRDVERVNSMGVHQWIPVVTRFSAKHRLVFDNISYPLVQNANVVANMFGAAQVRSCMAPYYCPGCKDNYTLSVTAAEVQAADGGAPAKKCTRCATAMEFDELDGYFAFFKARPRR